MIYVDFISFRIFYFLSKMALDPPTHFQIFSDDWNFLHFATSLNVSCLLVVVALKLCYNTSTLPTPK